MAIRVTCSCGKTVSANDELAGRRVKCPDCSEPISIPGGESTFDEVGSGMAELLDEIGMEATRTGIRCPNCRSDLQADAVLCIACGYNLETGKLLTTDSFVNKSKFSGVGAPTEKTKNGKSRFGFLGGLFGKK